MTLPNHNGHRLTRLYLHGVSTTWLFPLSKPENPPGLECHSIPRGRRQKNPEGPIPMYSIPSTLCMLLTARKMAWSMSGDLTNQVSHFSPWMAGKTRRVRRKKLTVSPSLDPLHIWSHLIPTETPKQKFFSVLPTRKLNVREVEKLIWGHRVSNCQELQGCVGRGHQGELSFECGTLWSHSDCHLSCFLFK